MVGLSPQDYAALCYHPTGLRPVRDFVDLRLTELVLHGWDIQSQLEPEAHLSAESPPVCLELLPGMFVWALRPSPSLPTPMRCRMVGADHVPHRYDLVSTGDQAWLAPAGADRAQITCTCDTETLVLLISGRLSLPVARAEGRLDLEGDRQWLTVFAQWFQGS